MSYDDRDNLPSLYKNSFLCPHCGALSHVAKIPVFKSYKGDKFYEADPYRHKNFHFDFYDFFEVFDHVEYAITRCDNCGKLHFWENSNLVYPYGTGLVPVPGMPEDVRDVFIEAQNVTQISPRSACALLRICAERIIAHAGTLNGIQFSERDPLYKKILKLNLPGHIQKIVDACRFAGNEGAHTGELDMSGEDTTKIAYACSFLVNQLVQLLISPAIQADKVLKALGKE